MAHSSWSVRIFIVVSLIRVSLSISFIEDKDRVFCESDLKASRVNVIQNGPETCLIENQSIELDNVTVSSDRNLNVGKLFIVNNKKVNFVPLNISEKFPSLYFIFISNCSIKVITGGVFENLLHLEILILRESEIEVIEGGAFDGLRQLIELDLRNNEISSLNIKIFKSLKHLRVLNMDSNKLTAIDENLFHNNHHLMKISLKHNKLQQISPGTFDGLKKISAIDLRFNSCVNAFYFEVNDLKDFLNANCGNSVNRSQTSQY